MTQRLSRSCHSWSRSPSCSQATPAWTQSSSVAQTSGPVVTGGLVTALGAPLAVLVDACTYLVQVSDREHSDLRVDQASTRPAAQDRASQ